MAKLYFRYGTVGSAKTLNMLAVAHKYEQQGKCFTIIKPKLDTRFGADVVKSRAGLERKADLLLGNDDEFQWSDEWLVDGCTCVLVDEAQFLDPRYIDEFRRVTVQLNIPVICYGLRTDFKTRLFPGAARLFELADTIEEIKTTCYVCNKKAVSNLKFIITGDTENPPRATLTGPSVQLGCEELYQPTCFNHFSKQTEFFPSVDSAATATTSSTVVECGGEESR